MGTTTPRFGLRKPADADPSRFHASDHRADYDTIDAALGFFPCTSGTRPASPVPGRQIRETDTGKYFVWTGSVWEELSKSGHTHTLANITDANTLVTTSSVRAVLFGTAVAKQANIAGYEETTSTSFVTLTGGPGFSFTTPPSGSVLVSISAALTGLASGIGANMTFQLRTGGTVGSGTVVYAAGGDAQLAVSTNNAIEAGRATLVTGLAANTLHNVNTLYRRVGSSSGAGFARRAVIVEPMAT